MKALFWFVIVPFLVAVVAGELYGLSPLMARRTAHLIARLVPEDEREFYSEQWCDDLLVRQERGYRFTLLLAAISFLFSIVHIRWDSRTARKEADIDIGPPLALGRRRVFDATTYQVAIDRFIATTPPKEQVEHLYTWSLALVTEPNASELNLNSAGVASSRHIEWLRFIKLPGADMVVTYGIVEVGDTDVVFVKDVFALSAE